MLELERFEYGNGDFITSSHLKSDTPLLPPFPDGFHYIVFGMGCFWGAEQKFWQMNGVHTTAAGYAGGATDQPDYRQICSGSSGHAEVVLVVFDPAQIDLQQLFKTFWDSHNPTQGMRQGNDRGDQYRSAIYTYHEQHLQAAKTSRDQYQQQLNDHDQAHLKSAQITTEIIAAPTFFYAEDYHQQYLVSHPQGYCGLGGIGVDYQVQR